MMLLFDHAHIRYLLVLKMRIPVRVSAYLSWRKIIFVVVVVVVAGGGAIGDPEGKKEYKSVGVSGGAGRQAHM